MAGLFAIVTVQFARSAGDVLNEALNGVPPGVPAFAAGSSLGVSNLYLSTAQRVASATMLITGVALGLAAISGLGLLAGLRWSRALAVLALTLASCATIATAIATVESPLIPRNARAVVEVVTNPALVVLGYIALILILVGRVPRFRSATSRGQARSWIEDAADDAGYERAP